MTPSNTPNPGPEPGVPPAAPDEVETVAALWLARRDAGLTAKEEEHFEAWLGERPRHREAWRLLTTTWEAFDRPVRGGLAPAMVEALAVRRQRRRRVTRIGVGAMAGLAAAAAWLLLLRPAVAPPPGLATTVAEAIVLRPERQVLPDQTVVELKPGAAIAVDYQPGFRRVRLLRGEAHFAVVRNAARPFVVVAGGVEVRDVGTEFALSLGTENVDLLVTEGLVAVNDPGTAAAPSVAHAPSAPILVPAGELLVVPEAAGAQAVPPQPQAVSPTEIAQRLGWREPRLELSGTPLAAAVAVFNRESSAQLTIAEPRLAQLRLSGVFRIDNAEGFVRLLESNYGVRVERDGHGAIILHAAP